MDFKEFKEILTGRFPEVDNHQLAQFEQLESLYDEWNAKINVISRKDIGGLYSHHVLHSLSIAAYLQTERPDVYAVLRAGGIRILDLGTGGGFPGIPMAILFPQSEFTLCDSVGKKTIVAQGVAEAIGLQNVTIVNARAESLEQRFNYVISRAVTALDKFYPWVKGKYDGSILYLKGGDLQEEMAALRQRYKIQEKSIVKWEIQNWLADDYFKDKLVLDISTK